MIKSRSKRTIDQGMAVLPCFAGETVRGDETFALSLENELLQDIAIVRLGQREHCIRLVELLPACHDFTMRWMTAPQHIETAFRMKFVTV